MKPTIIKIYADEEKVDAIASQIRDASGSKSTHHLVLAVFGAADYCSMQGAIRIANAIGPVKTQIPVLAVILDDSLVYPQAYAVACAASRLVFADGVPYQRLCNLAVLNDADRAAFAAHVQRHRPQAASALHGMQAAHTMASEAVTKGLADGFVRWPMRESDALAQFASIPHRQMSPAAALPPHLAAVVAAPAAPVAAPAAPPAPLSPNEYTAHVHKVAAKRGVTFVEALRIVEQATASQSATGRDKQAIDARMLAEREGISFVEAAKRLGIQQ